MSAEHELYTASVVYPEVCCLYTGHSGLDVQTYYRILSLFLSSLVVRSPPCTNTPEGYFAVDILPKNNTVYSKPLLGHKLYVACKQFITEHYCHILLQAHRPTSYSPRKMSSWIVWTNYDPSDQEPFTHWHSFMCQETHILKGHY